MTTYFETSAIVKLVMTEEGSDRADVVWDGSAGALAEQHGLRGYVAIHLTSALALETPELILVTWDADLVEAG